jgi:hypothetical protein
MRLEEEIVRTNGGRCMISAQCNIESFFNRINGMRKGEAILIAHQEALAAQRMLLSKKGGATGKTISMPGYREYSELLKEFIYYIRCDARPKLADDVKSRLFHAYLDSRDP